MIPVNRPVISDLDIKAVEVALRNTFISGEAPPVRRMEEKLAKEIGVKHVIAVSSGTSALDSAINALDIKKNDEILVPTFTIISTVNELIRKGARLKLIDSDPASWNMDSYVTAELIDKNTKLILPVHTYGLSVNMDPIINAAAPHKTVILEDAAEALGVKYKDRSCGSLGELSVFSFYANKIVTGGEGGAIATNNDLLAARIRSLINLGHSPDERFVHSEVAWNSRLNSMSASLISSQIDRLPDLITRKLEIAEKYMEGLDGHPWMTFQPSENVFGRNLYWVFGILLNKEAPYDAKKLQGLLQKNGVESRRFFCPIHLQPNVHLWNTENIGSLPVATNFWNRGIYLPSGLGNTNSEIEQVVDLLWNLTKVA